MQLIPVIDLADGRVVRARRGERESYRPWTSPLCPDAEPLGLLRRLHALAPFRSVYLADLDAIAGRPPQYGLIARLAKACPEVALWVDGAVTDEADWQAWHRLGVVPVVGSETVADPGLPARRPGQTVLSLDFDADGLRGPDELLDDPALWPERVIVMTLARVGGDGGPDFSLLRALAGRAGHRALFAAGGVRDLADIERLERVGVAGALVASCLHAGRLPPNRLVDYV